MFLLLVQSFSLFSQEDRAVIDTLIIKNDSLKADTVSTKVLKASKSAIDSKLTYKAVTVIKRDIINKRFTLIKNAVIDYGDIEIKADSIVINMNTNLLFAIGIRDTTGKVSGKPSFKEGSNQFESDELTYNFKTRKALIKNIITKQDAGLLHSAFTKLLEDGTSNISRSTYSTCDADTPHFYINLPKARVYPGKKIISGPGNLVLEGIPLPLAIPFGFFPIQTKKAASGLIIPRYGEERVRGFALTDGGYYFAIKDYIDLTVKGSLWANGSWLGNVQTDYKKLYKYSGNFSFSYANNVTGHQGLEDYLKTPNYSLGWLFTQDPKSSPGSRFSASVRMSSSGYDQSNSYNINDHVTTTRQSSISYSKSWDGTPFNFAISANHMQNISDKSVNLDLPQATFSMSRIYPFKSKNSSGTSKWWEEIQLSYSAAMDNKISTKDSLLFTSAVWKNMRNGFKQDIPLSLQINPFKKIPFSMSPSLTYSGVLYTQKIMRTYVPGVNGARPVTVIDTLHGFFYGQAVNPTFSASFNPQIFGLYDFSEKSPDSRLQSIRHVIKPAVSFSFTPSFAGLSSKMYRQEQVPLPYRFQGLYSVFDGNIYGTPSLAQKSGNISLSLVNIVEAKVFDRNDTTGKPKKIKLIDNFGVTTAYNIFADSIKWAPIAMQFRTTLMNNVNINASSSFSLYGTNEKTGAAIGEFLFDQKHKLMRLTNFSTSVDLSLSDLLKKNKDKSKPGNNMSQNNGYQGTQINTGIPTQDAQKQQTPGIAGPKDEYGYPVFNVPWTLGLSYHLSYTPTLTKSVIEQAVSFQGSVTITKKMSATFQSGYDFNAKKITMTNIGITRDLHCWEMNLNWVPNGNLQSWSFLIRVKAAVLGDLKYERRKDFHDSY